MPWKVIVVIPLLFHLVANGGSPVNGPQHLLVQVDRLAMSSNWPKAAPFYSQAESLFRQFGDQRNALNARLGYTWAMADSGVSPSIRQEIAVYLGTRVSSLIRS